MPSDRDVDLLLGGAGALAQGLQPYVQEAFREQELAKPLTGFQQDLGRQIQQLLMQGRDPHELAIRVKAGLPLEDHRPAPAAAQQQMGPLPQGVPAPQYEPIPYGPRPTEMPPQQRMGVSAPMMQQAPPQQGPQTRGDLQQLMQAAPFMQRAQANPYNPEALEFKYWQEGQRNKRFGQGDETKRRGQDFRRDTSDQNREESARQADERIKLGYATLRARLEAVDRALEGAFQRQRTGFGQNLTLESLKLQQRDLLQMKRSVAELLGSINLTMAPQVKEELAALQTEIEAKQAGLDADIKALAGQRAQPTSETVTRTRSSGRSSGSAAVPTGRTKTVNGVVWEEMSDGSARKKK